jgi:diguanylate cyclase (GGDEF)-like protein
MTGIIVFLLAPSLLFATLWIKKSLDDVRAVDRGLDALSMIRDLGPLIRHRIETNKPLHVSTELKFSNLDIFTPDEKQRLQTAYSAFLNQTSRSASVRDARLIVRTITQSVKLSSITNFETDELHDLVDNTLLTVIVEASEMVMAGTQAAEKPTINLWDKMSIPVQGGQFKFAADEAARITSAHFSLLPDDKARVLKELAAAYREANNRFQEAGAKLLMSTIDATRGSDIVVDPAKMAVQGLLNRTLTLWEGSIDYLVMDLEEYRYATVVSVYIACAIGALVILAAFGLAIMFGRAIANRTLEEFHKLGYHDPLTGLPNRRALKKTIEAIADTAETGETGLIQIDLRHFKALNHQYGDHVGDAVLRSTAEILIKASSDGDFVARTGGTEFMLLKRDIGTADDLRLLAESLTATIGREQSIHGHSLRLDSCIGISSTGPGKVPDEQLIIDAGLATRSAKNKGSLSVCVFRSEMRDTFEKNAEIAQELQIALSEGSIVPWYQPQVSVRTGGLVGAEALVRWVDIKKGVRFPGSFLPAATEAGYMDSIDQSVRDQAMRMTARLLQQSPISFHIGLNITANLLADPGCVDLLLNEVECAGLTPSRVSIEILEAVMIDEFAAAPIRANVASLSNHGFRIELDDFGTGHSSISSLRDLHIDRVKIDRSFVNGIDTDPGLQKFTRALIQLARSLDISVLAEGVETESERQWLADNGCDAIQGFLISKAIPESDLLAKTNRWNPAVVQFPRQQNFN